MHLNGPPIAKTMIVPNKTITHKKADSRISALKLPSLITSSCIPSNLIAIAKREKPRINIPVIADEIFATKPPTKAATKTVKNTARTEESGVMD